MDVSEEDKKILEAFHALTVKPTIETPEDLISYIKHIGKELEKDPSGTGDVKDASSSAAVKDTTATTVKMKPGAIPKGSTLHHYLIWR